MPEIKLPDFDVLLELINEITNLTLERNKLNVEIELNEADIVKRSTTIQSYWIPPFNKPPSMEYIKATYMFTGFNDDLIPKREQLVELTSKLKGLELKFEVYKMMIDVWRTQESSARTNKI